MLPMSNFNASFTVLLRTIIFSFIGFIFGYLIIIMWNLLGLPNGDDVGLFVLPLFTFGSGIGYIMYAKKKIGNNWYVGVGGIIGVFIISLMLLFALFSSS